MPAWDVLVVKRAQQSHVLLHASYTGQSVCPASCAYDAQLHETLKFRTSLYDGDGFRAMFEQGACLDDARHV